MLLFVFWIQCTGCSIKEETFRHWKSFPSPFLDFLFCGLLPYFPTFYQKTKKMLLNRLIYGTILCFSPLAGCTGIMRELVWKSIIIWWIALGTFFVISRVCNKKSMFLKSFWTDCAVQWGFTYPHYNSASEGLLFREALKINTFELMTVSVTWGNTELCRKSTYSITFF